MKMIDELVSGLLEVVGSNNINDILSELNINVFTVEPTNSLLQGNEAVYQRIGDFECIYISNDVVNKDFVIAHEIGHALLHIEEGTMFYNPLLNKGKLENEANYFACKLLYNDLEIEDGIETTYELANLLGVNEEIVKYVVGE